MPAADRLIDELRAVGRVDSTGEFTLDRDKAREKLRQFQLADPRRYVLLLVEAAVLKGATRIDFRIDADDMRMSFDGRPFIKADFDQAYGSLFTRAADDDGRARRQLALGLNAAMALFPRRARIDSGNGKSGAFLELRADRPDRFGPLESAPAGTRIHVKERFRPGLLVSFVRNLRGKLAEEVHLRESCGYADVEIVLEGQRLSHGLDGGGLPEGARRARFEGDGIAGVATLLPGSTDVAELRLVSNGVLAAVHRVAQLPLGFVCVASSKALQKDVSQGDVVRDEAYVNVFSAALRGCHAVLEELARGYERDAPDSEWQRLLLCGAVREHTKALVEAFQRGAPLGGLAAALADVSLWNALDASPASLRRIAEENRGDESIPHATDIDAEPAPGLPFVLRRLDADDRELLRVVLGKPLSAIDNLIAEAHARERRRRQWLERKTTLYLPEASYGARTLIAPPPMAAAPVVAEAKVEGEVALAPLWPPHSLVRFVAQGALLCERQLVLPVPALEVKLVADFAPTESYDDVRQDETLARAVLALTASLDRLFRAVAAGATARGWPPAEPERRALLQYLAAACRPHFCTAMLQAFGFPAPEATELASRLGDPQTLHPLRLGVGDHSLLGAASPGMAAAGEGIHPLARTALFGRVRQPPAGLVELAEQLARDGSIAFTLRPAPQSTLPGRAVLELDVGELSLLTELFGAAALCNVGDDLRQALRAAEHERQPAERVELGGDRFVPLPVMGEDFTGVVDLALDAQPVWTDPTDRAWPPLARTHFLRRKRFLAQRTVVCPVGPLEAVIDSEWVKPNGDWTDVEDPEFLRRVEVALREPSLMLLGEARARASQLEVWRRDAVRGFLLGALAAPFPSDEFRAAWTALVVAHGVEEAVKRYRRVLGAALLQGPQTVRHDGPETALFDAWLAGAAQWPRFPVPQVLLAAPLLRTLDGRVVTVGDAAEALHRDGRLRWLPADHPDVSADVGFALRLAPDELAALRRVVGAGALEDLTPFFAERQRRLALEGRPALDQVALAPGTAVVVETIATDPVTGEVGLPVPYPEQPPELVLTVASRRRLLRTLRRPCRWPLVALLNDDGLLPSPSDPSAVSPMDADRLAATCEARMPDLMRRVAREWAALPEEMRTAAWHHVLGYLAEVEPGRSLSGTRARANPTHQRLAELAGFRTAGGDRIAVVELEKHARQAGRVFYVQPEAVSEVPEELLNAVVVVSPFEIKCLTTMFREVEAYPRLSPVEREALRRRLLAPSLRAAKRGEALVRLTAREGKLKASLWLPRGPVVAVSAAFGVDDRVVEMRQVSRLLPCCGQVTGLALIVRPGFDGVELTEVQRRWLEKQTALLYGQLLDLYRERKDRDTGEMREMEAWLREALVRLACGERAGQLDEMPSEGRELFHRLGRLKLFVLGSGKRMNLAAARQFRPPELAGLGLWREEASVAHPFPRTDPLAAETEPVPQSAPPSPREPGFSPVAGGPLRLVPETPSLSGSASEEGAAEPTRPEPEPPPREELFLAELRRLLRELRTADPKAFGRLNPDDITLIDGPWDTLAAATETGVTLHAAHPAVRRAIDGFDRDPVALAFVLSGLFTVYNVRSESVSDAQEAAVQGRLAAAFLRLASR